MKKILFNKPYLTGDELKYIKKVFKNDVFYGNSTFTKLCEREIKKKIKSKYVLLTDSCTSALEISALIYKKNIGDEVIMPSYTFTSTASAFLKAGFKIKFVEIDPLTAMIDINAVKKSITKKTKVIVAVHYGSFAAELKDLKKLCVKHKIKLVEDAAQSFGSFINNKAVGTYGDIGCYSFHETKNIHAGLSGAITFKNKKDYLRASNIRERGTNRSEVINGIKSKYTWVETGGSYYPNEITAAFLYPQIRNVKKNISSRKIIYKLYEKELSELKKYSLINFNKLPKGYKSNFHSFFIILKTHRVREDLRKFLLKSYIHSYIGYIPLHSSPMGIKLGNKKNDLNKTELFSKKILRLPLHNNMTVKDVIYTTSKIRDFFKQINL